MENIQLSQRDMQELLVYLRETSRLRHLTCLRIDDLEQKVSRLRKDTKTALNRSIPDSELLAGLYSLYIEKYGKYEPVDEYVRSQYVLQDEIN